MYTGKTEDLLGFIELFKQGFSIYNFSLKGKVWKGRFPEESNIEVFVGKDNCRSSLFHAKVFRAETYSVTFVAFIYVFI
ncbi:DUF1122 family protein [Staphylothermus hellenicus]|uniref:Uncharacterized protein n=1 Tax=Staphylothermus hellenicus (strain DSM 12710 / JCM 10830 / BK20S6-10-b1 / P8) TaxID=591019 RepID=D7DCB3_STAHD|nr:DUF1122 family protein [Staphylothermus hellenicus]ADI31810.1 hypothetical protein Shell_0688 [Staphylothermus hellenicus DSM 12710]